MYQQLLSSDNEYGEIWDEHTLKAEVKYLKSYQRQEKELHDWPNAGNLRVLKTWARAYKLDISDLTVEGIDKVPNMPEILRTMFLQAIEWCTLKEKIERLVKYQAQQKQKNRYGTWSCWLHALEVF
ncbi:hypothetical protein COCOBI_18-2290 [Coccomyxa sp. Obi]|nr:hypothetical protein COCOBI_18-2290 [Coccomyxa sp. Obi]